MNDNTFRCGDASYAYEIVGEGPPVLLLHGFTGSQMTWENLIQSWKHQFTFIRVDLPGHGKTVTPSPRSMKTFSADMIKFLDYLSYDKIHLIGYSLGGRAALNFTMFYPERVFSLTLESASPGLEFEEERRKRIAQDHQLAHKIAQEGLHSFVKYWEKMPLFQTQKILPLQLQQSIHAERMSHTATGLIQSLQFMGTGVQPSWWGELSTLDVKTLLIVGSEDEKFVNINKRMKKALPHANYAEVELAGHAVHVEQPEIFGKLVVSFIKGL